MVKVEAFHDDPMLLWNTVGKTNPKHTKKVEFGRKFTAIDPYSQIKAATEIFGPAGVGWGWSVERIEYLPTEFVAVLVRLWIADRQHTIEQWGQADLWVSYAKKSRDSDCLKKATTDGVTKCLSYLGFNADVFLGQFDDNKYVQAMNQEFSAKEEGQKTEDAKQLLTSAQVLVDAIVESDGTIDELNQVYKQTVTRASSLGVTEKHKEIFSVARKRIESREGTKDE